MGPPSPAIKMLIGPRASGCASARRPPGREQGRATQRRGIPFPAPTAGLAGCGSVIRGWLRPDCSPREQLPRKMNIPLLPRPGPLAQSGPVVPVASPPRAGSLTPTLVRLLGGGEGGSQASGGRLRGAELSSPGTPPHARPARPARRALPDAVRGRAVQPRTRSPRAATDARAPPLRTRSQLGRSGTLPGITPATLVPGDSGPRGDALREQRPEVPGGREKGQWRRQALIGDICPRSRPLCGPEPSRTIAPRHWPLGLTSLGCKLGAGGRGKGYPPGCGASGESCSRVEGRKTTGEAAFREQGHGSPSPPQRPVCRVAAALDTRPLGERQHGGRPLPRARGQPG